MEANSRSANAARSLLLTSRTLTKDLDVRAKRANTDRYWTSQQPPAFCSIGEGNQYSFVMPGASSLYLLFSVLRPRTYAPTSASYQPSVSFEAFQILKMGSYARDINP